MKLGRPTLNKYLGTQYAAHIGSLLLILISVMSMFDAIELMRRLSKASVIDPGLIAYLTLLKVPGNILTIAPFIILFAGMFTLSALNRRQELTVIRTAGTSLWQLMRPFFVVAFLFGAVLVGIINPLSAGTERLYLHYEEKFLKKEAHMIALLGQGLWLRQSITDERGDRETGYILLHARKVSLPDWDLDDVTALTFTLDHRLRERLDAPHAALGENAWAFAAATLTRERQGPVQMADYRLKTTLTRADLEESFSSPETISFWQLPGFIHQLKASGFPVARLQIHFGALIMLPFLCMALVMIAVMVSVRPVRAGGQIRLMALGICGGFAIFFANNFLQALGASGQIPIWLATIGPALLTGATGIIAILGLEDS